MYSLRVILEVSGQESHTVHSLKPILEACVLEGHNGGGT